MNSRTSRAAGLVAVALVAMLVPTISTPAPAFAAEVQAIAKPGSSSLTTDAFEPNPININVGDTVIWTNNDSTPHTVTSGTGPDDPSSGQAFDSSPNFSPLWVPGDTFSHTFTEAGEFPYYCALHPNMIGTVIVTSAAGNGDGETIQEFMTTATIDGQSFDITGKSATSKATAATIEAGEAVKVTFDKPGEVELTLPKDMIDGINAVMAGGQQVQFEETDSTDSTTTIKFTVPEGSTSVDIMGTTVIPEFPVIAALVLAVSMVAIIGYTRFAKNGTGLFGRI